MHVRVRFYRDQVRAGGQVTEVGPYSRAEFDNVRRQVGKRLRLALVHVPIDVAAHDGEERRVETAASRVRLTPFGRTAAHGCHWYRAGRRGRHPSSVPESSDSVSSGNTALQLSG